MAGSLHYINVVPFFANDIAYMVREARRVADRTGLKEIAFSLSLHPEGTPARRKAEYFRDAFAALKAALRTEPDLHAGILLQSTIGHGWSGAEPLTQEPWRHTVFADGGVSARICHLDNGFRAYILEAVKELAALEPAFFLVDDDFRIQSGECFCELHMAEYRRRLGRMISREELVAELNSAPASAPAARMVRDVLYDGLIAFAGEIRAAIDRGSHSMIRCGMCCPGAGHYRIGELTRTLAGGTEPFLRIANAVYGAAHPLWLAEVSHYAAMRMKAAQRGGRVRDLLDEADLFPHNLYSESARTLHAHLTCAILQGLTGAKLWLTAFDDELPESGEPYEAIFSAHRGFYDELHRTVSAGVHWRGAVTPLPDPEGDFHILHPEKSLEFTDFVSKILYRFGIPGYFEFDAAGEGAASRDTPRLLSGTLAERFSDAEIARFFRGALLLDSTAARNLAARGFSREMGVDVGSRGDFFFTAEIAADGERSGLMWDEWMAELLPRDNSVQIGSRFFRERIRGLESSCEAPGMTFYTNSSGGRVAVLGWHAEMESFKLFKPFRKKRLLEALAFLSGEAGLPPVLENFQDAMVRCGTLPDGRVLWTVVNCNIDPLRPRVRCRRVVRGIERLTPAGRWEAVPFRASGPVVAPEVELALHEPGIFRFDC